MKRSFFMNDAKPSGTNIAHGYVPVGEGFEIRDTYPTFSGSGGLMVTINDLARFDRDIEVGHKVWTPAVSKIMTTPWMAAADKPRAASFSASSWVPSLVRANTRIPS